MITITPLSGARQEHGGPRCYLLELDHHRILLDVGINPVTMDSSHLDALKQQQHGLSAVLLSHYDINHVGGLPFIQDLCKETMVLGTTPVMHLARQSLLDAKLAYKERFGTDYPECLAASVESACDLIKPVRYSQPIQLPIRDDADSMDVITVMAMPAGHSLGGAMWRIRRHLHNHEDLIYSVDFDHRRGVCLEGAAFDLLSRPTCLMVDCRQALTVAEPRRERDALLLSTLKQLLVKNNVVLMPVDPCPIELLFMMERWCEEQELKGCQVHFMTSTSASRTVDYFKGMLEWMGPAMMRQFDQKRDNPFHFKHIRCDTRLSDLQGTAGPKLILASGADLVSGPSLQVFMHYSASTHFHVLFTSEPLFGSIGAKLLALSEQEMTITSNEAEPLEGTELLRYKREQRQRREQEDAAVAAHARLKKRFVVGEVEGSESSDDSDGEDAESRVETMAFWSDFKTDLWISIDNTLYSDPTRLPSNTIIPQFCYKEQRQSSNDYGQVVPTEWISQHETDLVEQARLLIQTKKSTDSSEPEQQQELPVKWVERSRKVVVKCHRRVMSGFEGVSDGKSVRNIIGQLAPRRLVLLGGSPSATDYLYNHYLYSASIIGLSQVLAPTVNTPCTLSTSYSSLSAALDESLTETISLLHHPPYHLGHLQCKLSPSSDTATTKTLSATTPRPMQPVMVGEIRLGDFRRALLQLLPHVTASFDRGDLVIREHDSSVTVRRQDEGQWCIEGNLVGRVGETVRNLFYTHLAII